MSQNQRSTRIPRPKQQTERQRLIELLLDAPLQDAKELSGCASISEKDVYKHLVHIEKSLKNDGMFLVIHPSSCSKCGFTFTKKGQFSKPGRCPDCKGTRIVPPAYTVERK